MLNDALHAALPAPALDKAAYEQDLARILPMAACFATCTAYLPLQGVRQVAAASCGSRDLSSRSPSSLACHQALWAFKDKFREGALGEDVHNSKRMHECEGPLPVRCQYCKCNKYYIEKGIIIHTHTHANTPRLPFDCFCLLRGA